MVISILKIAVLASLLAIPALAWDILPSSYLNVTFGQCRSNINSYALETMKYVQNAFYNPPGYLKNGLPYIAEWDAYHNTTTFEDYFNTWNVHYRDHPGPCHTYWNVGFVNQFNDFPGWSSIGALVGMEAYGNDDALQEAKDVFEFVSTHGYIHQSDIDAAYLVGTKPTNNTLSKTCNGMSLINGVYWENGCPTDPSYFNPNVNAVSTGLYATLGAQLCEMTGNMTYCDLAYLSLQWIDRFLKTDDSLILDHINATSCEITTGDNWIFTYNAALYIRAYSLLGHLTSNDTAINLARETAISSMTTSVWNDPRGIIDEQVSSNLTAQDFSISFPPVLINYLRRSYPYFDTDVQSAIIRYINIQYYGLTQLDSNNPTHPVEYGRNWTGPGFEVATGQTVSAAAEVLNAVLEINPENAFPSDCSGSGSVASIA